MEHWAAMKKKKPMLYATTWMNLTDAILGVKKKKKG